jgi:hypothetical protein
MAKRAQLSPLSLFGVSIAIIGLAVTLYAITQSTEFRQRAAEGAVLYIIGNPQVALSGQNLDVSLDVQTDAIPIQTAIVVLIYPREKLELLSLDFKNSPFDIPSENIHNSGYIRIGREASYPTNGKSHIATLRFQAKQTVNLSDIKPVTGTSILNSENKNIYDQAVSYTSQITEDKPSLFSIQFFVRFFRDLFK